VLLIGGRALGERTSVIFPVPVTSPLRPAPRRPRARSAFSGHGGRTWSRFTLPGVRAFAFGPAVAAGAHGTVGWCGLSCATTGRAMPCGPPMCGSPTPRTVAAPGGRPMASALPTCGPAELPVPNFAGECQGGGPRCAAASSSPGSGPAARNAYRRPPRRATRRCRRPAGALGSQGGPWQGRWIGVAL